MGVKPVEYVKDSSTSGFAVAGDEKPITQTNANTIQKDVNQGNTKDLDNAQDKYLSSLVDEDTIDYNPDEQKNVGANQIDTKGEDGEDLSEKNSGGSAAASTAMSVVAGLSFFIPVLTGLTIKKKAGAAGDGISQALMAAIIAVAAAGTVATSLLFDPNKGERENQTNNAEQNNQTIQAYYDTLSGDMDEMVNDSERYKELLAGKTQSDVDMITELGVLQAELAVYQAQGDTEKAAEIQAKIDEIKNGAKDDPAGAELADIKEGLETYAGHYNESIGVAESGATVSEFLKDGYTMKTFADINMYMALACALLAASSIVIWSPKIPPFDVAPNITAKILMGVAAALFATSAGILGKTAKVESDAGHAGSQMGGLVGELNENIEAQGGFTEETSAGYAEGDAEYTQTTQKTQEGVDNALKAQKSRLNSKGDDEGSEGGEGGEGDNK